MQPAHAIPVRSASILLACFIATGCASAPPAGPAIHDSPRGAIFLEPIRTKPLQATHPVTIEAGIIAKALRGIQVRDDRSTLQFLFGSRPEPVRAFSDEEADFFAPWISIALAKASPGQQVAFRLNQADPLPDLRQESAAKAPPGPTTTAPEEITSGALFVHGRSLHIHLTQFRSGIQPRSRIDGPNRQYVDRTGLTGRKLEFVPREAERPEAFRLGEAEFPTLVLDYDLLARLPEQSVAPTPVPAITSPATPADPPAARAADVEALKKELQEIKQQLNEQQSKTGSPKSKNNSTP